MLRETRMQKYLLGFVLKFFGITVVLIGFATSVATAQEIKFLSIDGVVTGVEDQVLLQDVLDIVVKPLQLNPKIALFSYMINVSGPGHVTLHFAAEPASRASVEIFDQYIKASEAQKIHGLSVQFKNVVDISEVAQVRAGHYVSNQDDPFSVSFEVSKKIHFKTMSEWQKFTDSYGEALLNPDHEAFKKYISEMITDSNDLSALAMALKKSNMMAVDPRVYLTLEDGSIVGGESDQSPFIPFQFFRNCYESRFENGMCF